MKAIGIRREDKSRWERRVPLIPGDLAELIRRDGIAFRVQPSEIRIFDDEAYRSAGAAVEEDLSGCAVVMAVKEIPIRFLQPERTYVFFSHTMKGQKHNMDMLRKLVELRCSVIDYELVTDASGRRLVFFGQHAGLAGMIDSMWALGRRLLERDGLKTPFLDIEPAHAYETLEDAKKAVRSVGLRIGTEGLPEPLTPFICGFAGYGNVSQGAQEIYDLLPVQVLDPAQLLDGTADSMGDSKTCFKVVFKEEHMVRPASAGRRFDLQEYYDHPDLYEGCFDPYLDHISVLVNCIYWDERYPRLVTRQRLSEMFGGTATPRLALIGDVTCDIEGSIEATLKATGPDDPVYVYNPSTGQIAMGVTGAGMAILAVDNLPCELSREASEHFSASLRPFVAALAKADLGASFEETGLPEELSRALILKRGEFTLKFRHMEQYIS
jgi:alpha-aminoadipic semialdehyde synthase